MSRRITITGRVVGLVMLLVCTTLLSDRLTSAQDESTPTPDPEGQPIFDVPPEIQATHEAEEAIFNAQYHSRSIFDFRIAYLIAEDAEPAGSLVESANMAKILGAEAVHDWDELLSLNEDTPFHMILVHESMAEQVDPEWMGDAYRNDVQIVGIDLLPKVLKSLVRDKCVGGAQRRIAEWYDHFVFYFIYHVELEHESDREYVYEQQLERCKRVKIEGYGSFAHGVMNFPLHDADSLQYLADSLLMKPSILTSLIPTT